MRNKMKRSDTLYKRIRIALAVITERTLRYTCQKLHRGGTTIPGLAARVIDPQLMAELAAEVRILIITGTNGKTTAVHMAAHMLDSIQIPCAYSRSGENISDSMLTVLTENYSLRKHGPVNDIVILECDEKYTVKLLNVLGPECITVTNICKDQTDRLGLPEDVVKLLYEGLSDYQGTVCINTADNYSKLLAEKLRSKKITEYCSCGNEIIIQGKSYQADLSIPGKYNVSNAAAAMALLHAAGLLNDAAAASLQSMPPVFGRMERIMIGSTPVIMNLAKNPSGVYESLRYISEETGPSRVILGFNNKTGDGSDQSWLSDVSWKDYEKLFTDVIVFNDKCDEAEKLMCSLGIPYRPVHNLKQLTEMIKESRDPVFMILNYTCMMKVRKGLVRQKYVSAFWK